MLGLDRVGVYDLYVPIVAEVKREFTWEAGVETVLGALGSLGDDYRSVLAGGLDSRWVDVYENVGKTSGAYSWGVYGVHPFILMNWSRQLREVFTLAHEAGHAMHSHYSSNTQPYVYSHYTLFVAEVASTVNELLLTDALRRQTDDRLFEAYLVNHVLEDLRGTLMRQTMFAEFERWACLLYTSDAADERSSVALGGRRIITTTTDHRAPFTSDASKTRRTLNTQ